MPLGDMMYGLGLKVYSTLSTRRAMSVMGAAVAAGRMSCEPSYSTPIRYFGRPRSRRCCASSFNAPLCRSATSRSIRTGQQRLRQHRLQPLVRPQVGQGIQAGGQVGEGPRHVRRPDEHRDGRGRHGYAVGGLALHGRFRPGHRRELPHPRGLGRPAYSSRANLHAVADAGGTAYIPFKTNAVARQKGSGRKTHDALWEKMYLLFTLHEAEFTSTTTSGATSRRSST